MPGLAMVAVRRIGIERRRGNTEAVASLYSRLIAEADSAEVRSFYTIKYARYQAKVRDGQYLLIVCATSFCRCHVSTCMGHYLDCQFCKLIKTFIITHSYTVDCLHSSCSRT